MRDKELRSVRVQDRASCRRKARQIRSLSARVLARCERCASAGLLLLVALRCVRDDDQRGQKTKVVAHIEAQQGRGTRWVSA